MILPAHPLDPSAQTYGYAPADPTDAPAVSVITPFYNTAPAMFEETIRSLLRQSLQQWEWLVVNDGSDDPAALRTLLPLRTSADPRIRVLDQPNCGVSAARNAGVAAARAPLLFFLDSDNMLAPTALEKLAWSLEGHPASDFAGTWTVVFGAEELVWTQGFATPMRFPTTNTVSSQAMARREAFLTLGGFHVARRGGLEDWELWVRAADAGRWGHDVAEPLVWNRRKAPHEYPSYRWAFHADPNALAAFRAEMRARHPRVFRDGPPQLPGDGGPLDTHVLVAEGLPFPNRLRREPGQRRVLLILPAIRTGGADRFALDMARDLVARGDRVTVCLTRGDLRHTWMDELLRITPDVFNLATFLTPADYPRFLHYLVESRGITTALLTNSLLGYQLLPYLRSHCPGLAVADYQHAEQPERHGGFPQVGVEHSALVDLHITASEHLRSWMIARGVEPGRVEVCRIHVDTTRWAPDPVARARVRAELGLAPDVPLILFVGRLSAEKRPALAVEVLHLAHTRGAHFEALFVGAGEDGAFLRSMVRRYRLAERVRLLGDVPHTRVRELMTAGDMLLLPSEREGIALTLYEALASGVVPLAADVGGQRELVTPECGVLVPPGPDESTRYTEALLALLDDPRRREAMARAGRTRVVAAFDAHQSAEQMATLLDWATELAAHEPRPRVDAGVGLASATLAMEHFQLERKLRALPPVRLLIALRWSSARRMLGPLGRARAGILTLARRLYTLQRGAREAVRRGR